MNKLTNLSQYLLMTGAWFLMRQVTSNDSNPIRFENLYSDLLSELDDIWNKLSVTEREELKIIVREMNSEPNGQMNFVKNIEKYIVDKH